jgi:thiopurine S-methyltransferase
MDADFWHERWSENRIGFHKDAVNPALVAQIGALGLSPGDRVFVPLCGKTRDIGWLLAQGYAVVGAELSRIAVDQLFADLGVTPVVQQDGAVTRLSAPGLDVLVGDIFDVDAAMLGRVAAVYDRAALIALPHDMRTRYAAHMAAITGAAPQLLICLIHGSGDGPPFSVDAAEVQRVYGGTYARTLLTDDPAKGGVKGDSSAREVVWQLEPVR